MKNAWKKTLAIVLCALLMVTVVAGCDPQDEGGKTTTSSSTTTTASTGEATDPTDPTDPSVTDPSATDPSVTDPSATDTTTGTTASTKKPTTKKPTTTKPRPTSSATIKIDVTTVKTTTTTKPNAQTVDRAIAKAGKGIVHSDKVPYVTGDVYKFSVMLPYSTDSADMASQAFTKFYQERSGMQADYMFYTSSDIFVLKSTMFNSGNIADLFVSVPVGMTGAEVEEYGGQGFFKDLTSLLEIWAPNVYGRLHSGRYNYARSSTYASGKVYALPTLRNTGTDKRGVLAEFQPMINTEWLDELGLEIPTTMDEFYEVCKAFTTEDPDGNGKNDTYGYGNILFGPAMWNPWGLGMSWYVTGTVTEKGEVLSAPLTEQFREGCRFYNRLWEEGLMNKDMYGASSAAYKSLVSKTGIIGGAVSSFHISQALTESEMENWQVISWPAGNNTGDFKPSLSCAASSDCYENMFFISKDAKSPEAILRWLDYFYTADGAMLWAYGPEGKAYKAVDGNYKLLGNANESAKDQKVLCAYYPMEKINVLPQDRSELTPAQRFTERIKDEAFDTNIRSTYHFDWLDQLASKAEKDAIKKLQLPGDWNWGVKAIRGEVDVETDWNNYLTENSKDYETWKKIYQGVFDRYFK